MSYDSYHKRKIGKHVLKPETQMMGYGYDPSLSEGSLKPPIFLTSTFVFRTAQDGKDFFDYTSGRREPAAGKSSGLVYSRFNNPNLEVLEDRLALWEEGETAAVFSSGMSAISTVLWAHARPGDVILMSQPLYGGTETLIERTLPAFGVGAESFTLGHDKSAVADAARRAAERAAAAGGRVCLIMVETPANPTNSLVDLKLMQETSLQIGATQKGGRPPVVVDNTFLGPVFQRPLAHGADLVMYSLTKYVGGHRTWWRRGGRLPRRRGSGEEAARRPRHPAGSEHRVDDHALDGDAVAANAQVGGKRRAGREFFARTSQGRQRELSGFFGCGRRALPGISAAMRERRLHLDLRSRAARRKRFVCSMRCRSSSLR